MSTNPTKPTRYSTRNEVHHWTDPSVQIRVTAELAKIGLSLSKEQEPTKRELLKDRNSLREAINSNARRAQEFAESNKIPEYEDCLENVLALKAMVERAERLLDLMEVDDSRAQARGRTGNKGNTGSDVRALAPTERLSAMANRDEPLSGKYGFGDFVRAMVLGTNNPDIRNSLSEGTDSAGGATVPTYLMREVIDAMRAQTVVIQAGAVTVPLDTQKTVMARVATDPTAGWRLENGAIAESDPTFEKVEFTAHSLAVLVKVPRELLEDSVNLNAALTAAFAGSMAVEVDKVALFGTGTAPQPKGIFNTAGIGTVDMATNGATLANWNKVLDTVLEMKTNNSPDPTAMVMAPRTWRTIAGFADTTGQPLRPPVAVENVARLVSTIVPITQTQGSASNASCIVAGDFSQLMLGVRTHLRIEVLRERFAENHQYAFVAHLRMDVQLARAKAFAVLRGIIP
jgi:HK97 family phage major capsid protein